MKLEATEVPCPDGTELKPERIVPFESNELPALHAPCDKCRQHEHDTIHNRLSPERKNCPYCRGTGMRPTALGKHVLDFLVLHLD